jgi:hypothetical protein
MDDTIQGPRCALGQPIRWCVSEVVARTGVLNPKAGGKTEWERQ